ncbi:toll/interleukin-1 receptor domain-containing protein [Algoriphagus yeomjeoni]|uniref:TIR domain-containing protein n=1 Tax=Algoriphagus yeomjeoni TaxID=291403 RepID=A0A327P0D8_9BACT|nr:toll/interleukin-1 receptor domain-containing protein [Algoriphagus yeomjeoni]RAI85825.1 TIR domain-containing protein [Algoriphagus yeomjeoni]
MEKGINRASEIYKIKDLIRSAFTIFPDDYNDTKLKNGSKPCVFLSHKNEDKEACLKIGKYLEEAGIDYYLDIYDKELQYAAEKNDPIKITHHIKEGIRLSSHMIVVISEKTINSQWVPFEIGYGHASIVDKTDKNLKNDQIFDLAFLALKEISDLSIPDFLKIAFPIRGIKSLNEYIEKIKPDEVELKKYYTSDHPLEKNLSWDK